MTKRKAIQMLEDLLMQLSESRVPLSVWQARAIECIKIVFPLSCSEKEETILRLTDRNDLFGFSEKARVIASAKKLVGLYLCELNLRGIEKKRASVYRKVLRYFK